MQLRERESHATASEYTRVDYPIYIPINTS